MDAGIPIDLFWELSINEILDVMESHARAERRKRKDKILDDFIIAEVTAMNLAALWSEKNVELPKPWDYYPNTFSDEMSAYMEGKRTKELEEYKARKREYIKEFNKRRRS